MTAPGKANATIAKLGALEQVWRERAAHWAASDVDQQLKDGMARTVAEDGEAFWAVVNQRLVPASQRGDAAARLAALAELETIYQRHRARIDELVATGERLQTELDDSATTTVMAISAGLTLVALLVLGSLWGGLAALRRRAIEPLGVIADTMHKVATGDLEAGQRTSHSDDEIGTMTRAIETFREAAMEARSRCRSPARGQTTANPAGGLRRAA